MEIDYSQYTCEKCGKRGVCEDGMDVFIACLCQECFDKEWEAYEKAMTATPEFLEAKARVKKQIDDALQERFRKSSE